MLILVGDEKRFVVTVVAKAASSPENLTEACQPLVSLLDSNPFKVRDDAIAAILASPRRRFCRWDPNLSLAELAQPVERKTVR